MDTTDNTVAPNINKTIFKMLSYIIRQGMEKVMNDLLYSYIIKVTQDKSRRNGIYSRLML